QIAREQPRIEIVAGTDADADDDAHRLAAEEVGRVIGAGGREREKRDTEKYREAGSFHGGPRAGAAVGRPMRRAIVRISAGRERRRFVLSGPASGCVGGQPVGRLVYTRGKTGEWTGTAATKWAPVSVWPVLWTTAAIIAWLCEAGFPPLESVPSVPD